MNALLLSLLYYCEQVLSATPWVPVVGNHEGYDSFYFYFNETDGENSEVDPADGVSTAGPSDGATAARRRGRLPHPMTTILRTGVGQFGAGALGSQSTPRPTAGAGQRRLDQPGSGTPRWFSLQVWLFSPCLSV